MDGLLLERLPGLPAQLRLAIGKQLALVVADAATARFAADLITGLEDPPADVVVKAGGPVRLVPAEGGLLPHLTVLGNVVHGHTVTHRVTAGLCGLGDVLDRYPHEITPGRRRLAGLARALRADRAVIVLEDAAGLPTWGSLLQYKSNPLLKSAALLLITTDIARTDGFVDDTD
jgi:ABC-type thiamine transport system ATPase subunit